VRIHQVTFAKIPETVKMGHVSENSLHFENLPRWLDGWVVWWFVPTTELSNNPTTSAGFTKAVQHIFAEI